MEQNTEIDPKDAARRLAGQFTNAARAQCCTICAPIRSSAAPESIYYGDWFAHRTFMLVPAQAIVAKRLESFKEFPPRAKAASFTVSDAMEKITSAANPNK